MKKNKRDSKKIVFFITAAVLGTALFPKNAYAAGWKKNDRGWWYSVNETDTSWYSNCWRWIDGNHDGIAECYRFDSDGYLYVGGKTLDSVRVDSSGAWIVDGVVQTRPTSEIKEPDRTKSNRFTGGLNDLEPDPARLAQVEAIEEKSHVPYKQKYWYARLDIDYDDYDMSEPHIMEEKLALSAYLSVIGWDAMGKYVSLHQNYRKTLRDRELFSQGYEAWTLTDEEVAEMKEAEQAFLEEYITEDMSDFEKEMEIVKYLCENVEYDYDTKEKNEEGTQEKLIGTTGYGALINGLAVCDGYANAFYRLCSVCGIEANIVHGTVESGKGHEWNMVKLDDGWYWVDVTWADNGDDVDTKYVNGTSAELEKHKSISVNTGKNIRKPTGKKYGKSAVEKYLNK